MFSKSCIENPLMFFLLKGQRCSFLSMNYLICNLPGKFTQFHLPCLCQDPIKISCGCHISELSKCSSCGSLSWEGGGDMAAEEWRWPTGFFLHLLHFIGFFSLSTAWICCPTLWLHGQRSAFQNVTADRTCVVFPTLRPPARKAGRPLVKITRTQI